MRVFGLLALGFPCRLFYNAKSVILHPVYGEIFQYLIGKFIIFCYHFVLCGGDDSPA